MCRVHGPNAGVKRRATFGASAWATCPAAAAWHAGSTATRQNVKPDDRLAGNPAPHRTGKPKPCSPGTETPTPIEPLSSPMSHGSCDQCLDAASRGPGRKEGSRLCVEVRQRRGEILLFYLAPGSQRQGIGRMIHATLERKAAQWGLESLYLESTALACPFYEALGYQPTGRPVLHFGVLQCFPHAKQLQPGKSPRRMRQKSRAA